MKTNFFCNGLSPLLRSLDMLILNAGVMVPAHQLSRDDLELSYQVSFVDKFLILS